MTLYRFIFERGEAYQPAPNLARAFDALVDNRGPNLGKLLTVECDVLAYPRDKSIFEIEMDQARFRVQPDYQPYCPRSEYDPGSDAMAWPHRIWISYDNQWHEVRDFSSLLPGVLEWIQDECTKRLVG